MPAEVRAGNILKQGFQRYSERHFLGKILINKELGKYDFLKS